MTATIVRPSIACQIDRSDFPDPCRKCDVHDLTLCAPLSRPEARRLADIVAAVDFEPGTPLFDEGEPANHVFNVTAGAVRLYKLLPDGRRSITGFLFAGDFLGLPHREVYAYSAEGITTGILCRFPRRQLEALFEEIPKLEKRLLGLASNELAAAQDQMLLLGRKTAAEKVATFLLILSRRQERRHLPANPVSVPMSRSDIADYLGLTTETVSRTFTQMKKQGAITLLDHSQVQINDLDRLAALSESL